MIRLGIRWLVGFAATLTTFVCSGDDVHYWATFNTQGIELNDDWKTASHLQIRSPEMDFLQYGRFSQKFLRAAGENWTLGAHPAIEFTRSSPASPWANHYRIEIEATGKFNIDGGPALTTRSRWEFRLRDGSGGQIIHLVRQQFKATWKLEGLGVIDSYTLANEAFYLLDHGQIVANRFLPITVGFKSSGKVRTAAWLMYFSRRSTSTGEWSGSYVLGADFRF